MKYTEQQAFNAFDSALKNAQDGVNFGPMNGFGGFGSGKVWAKLPDWFKKHYNAFKLPIELVVGSAKSIVHYADACRDGKGKSFLGNTAFCIECYEDHHNVKIIDGPSSKTESRSRKNLPRGLRDDGSGSKNARRSKKS